MEKGFNREGFLNWLKEEFPGCLDNEWDYKLVDSILEDALDSKCISKNQLCYYLSDVLPDVDYLDVAVFCKDNLLTDDVARVVNGLRQIYKIEW